MKGSIPETLLHLVPNRFQVIGDVAVISIPQQLNAHMATIAGMIMHGRANIKTVLNKDGMLEGEERVAAFRVLAGGDTRTVHRENGYLYRLDVKEVFFNSRLSFERARIASKVTPGERVLVPFCGVGPFAIPAAAQGARVVAVEKNEQACRWLAENIHLNRFNGSIAIIRGDASCIRNMINDEFDRVIVPTPYGMDRILHELWECVRKGGRMHFYTFKKEWEIQGMIECFEANGFSVDLHRRCGNVAPGVSRWVFDLIKQ